MAKTREFVLYSDATMSNPNGDMINDNRPRQDERTGCLEMSDVRIKRYVRDEWVNRGEKIFVKPVKNDKGDYIDCKGVAKKVITEEGIKDADLEQKLKDEYIDVKLFGAVVTAPKFNITGPLQVMWSRSINQADIKFAQGTSVFTSKGEASQGTIWSKYFTPYALFKTYMVYNDMVAKRQNISVSEDDIENFKQTLLTGIKSYKSTSKNQMPRLLAEIVYKDNYIDGEMDYIRIEKKVSDLEQRGIEDFAFDLSPLVKYYNTKTEHIEKINIYQHEKVVLAGKPSEFNYFEI